MGRVTIWMIAAGSMLAAALAMPAWAYEDFKLPASLEKLAQHATESVDVTLDSSMLQLASKFLSNDPDEAKVKKLVSKLKSVYVRSFEFDKEGQYSLKDVESLSTQFKAPDWSKIVSVKSQNGENSEIFMKRIGNQISGIMVIAAEPKELTIVHIDGPIDPEELSELGGHMGIPRMRVAPKSKDSKPAPESDK